MVEADSPPAWLAVLMALLFLPFSRWCSAESSGSTIVWRLSREFLFFRFVRVDVGLAPVVILRLEVRVFESSEGLPLCSLMIPE